MSIIFDDQILETGLVHEVDGLTLTFSSTGVLGNYNLAPFEGVWIGQSSTTADYYELTFSEPVTSITISFDASNSFATPVETFSNFGVSLDGSSFEDVTVSLIASDGVSISNNTITTNLDINQPAGAGGTFTYSGDPFDVFRFYFTQAGGNNGTVIERVEVDSVPVIFLDFDTPLDVRFVVMSVFPFGLGNEYVDYVPGSEPLGSFTPEGRARIVSELQAIFDRSGVEVIITQERPESGDYHTVRFSSSDVMFDSNNDGEDSRLMGTAYQGVDRFNENPDDVVAVFMDEDSYSIFEIVETVAHELGHALGLRHINPVEGRSSEVMDYQDSILPQFTNSVSWVLEPPEDGEVPGVFAHSHNPIYHLRRYLLGEDDADLRAEGILPGSYDLGLVEMIRYTVSLVALDIALSNVTILIHQDVGDVDGEDTLLGSTQTVAQSVVQGDSITFLVPADAEFSILASSGDPTQSDILIEIEDPQDNGRTGSVSGNVLQFSSAGAVGVQIGQISGQAAVESEIGESADDLGHLFTGTNDADSLTGTDAAEVFFGLDGPDRIVGSGGNDSLIAGQGDDTLLGGPGEDTLSGGAGSNEISGGGGQDWVDFSDAPGRVFADLQIDQRGAGFLRFYEFGQASGDTFSSVEHVVGGIAADNLRGSESGNSIVGGGSSDRLYGRAGDDTIDGGTGADAIFGGLGADVMTGGEDEGRRDRYIYFNIAESEVGEGNRDVILDFVSGEDRIEISRFDADVTTGFRQDFVFIADSGFSGTAGELGYRAEGGNTIVQADTDGDGVADFEIELTGNLTLTEDDFLL